MARRPNHDRASIHANPGTIVPWPAFAGVPELIAKQTSYKGNGQHKTYTSPTAEWTPALKSGKSKCDKYPVAQWPLLTLAIRKAILSRCVSEEFRGIYPARLWAYINGVLHEARITNELTGEYHGFPLDYEEEYPVDPSDLLRKCPNVEIPSN